MCGMLLAGLQPFQVLFFRVADFRCGSKAEVSDGHENVRSWGKSRLRFRVAGCLLVAMCGRLPVGKGCFDGNAVLVGAAMCSAC
jgi:hypothetical protein